MYYLKKETIDIVKSILPDSVMFDKISCIPDSEERMILIKAAKKFIDYRTAREVCPKCKKYICCEDHYHDYCDCGHDDCWICLIGRSMDQLDIEEAENGSA